MCDKNFVLPVIDSKFKREIAEKPVKLTVSLTVI